LRAPTADPVAVTPKVRFWKVAIGAIAVIALVVGIAIGALMRSDGTQVPATMPDAALPVQIVQPAAPPAPAEVKAPIAPISTVQTGLSAKTQAPKPRATKIVRPVPAQAPGVDAGIEAKPVDEPKTKPVVPDRDRAVNPFAKKRKETP
jgi:hypothetical protein